MKNLLFLIFALIVCNACTKDEAYKTTYLTPRASNVNKLVLPKTPTTINSLSGRAVCGSVTNIKLVPKLESNGSTTVTTEYSIKNCTNIVPVSIYLDVTDRNTNQQVKLFSGLPFSSKIPFAGLKSGDYYQFTVFVLRDDTQEVIDAQAQFISIP